MTINLNFNGLNLVNLATIKADPQKANSLIKSTSDSSSLKDLAPRFLKPQLAYDPKIGTDYKLFYSYAATQFDLACYQFHCPKGSLYAEEKIDGVRCQFLVSLVNDKLEAYAISRANKLIYSVGHLVKQLLNDKVFNYLASLHSEYPTAVPSLIIDTELFVKDSSYPSGYLPFRIVNGLANRRQPDAETSRLSAYIFQIYLIDYQGLTAETVEPKNLEHFVWDRLGLQPESNWAIANHWLIGSADQLASLAESMRQRHAEGLVIKSPDYRHINGRTKNWLKLKFRKTGTYRLVDVIAGEGKCLGYAGAILIQDRNGLTSLVGTGFTDEDRRELSSLDLSKPTFVDIEYMTKTGTSLREASFLGIRYDLIGLTGYQPDEFSTR